MSAECTCPYTDPSTWLSAASCGYGSGYEPGSMQEWNPDCPAHPAERRTAPYKADQIAAERLLKAAVRQASRELAHAIWVDSLTGHVGEALRTHDRREAVVQMLAEATRAADLLLKGRPA